MLDDVAPFLANTGVVVRGIAMDGKLARGEGRNRSHRCLCTGFVWRNPVSARRALRRVTAPRQISLDLLFLEIPSLPFTK